MDRYFAEELSRLRTDYVDVYLMHHLTDIAMWEKLKKVGVLDWIQEKKESGRIRIPVLTLGAFQHPDLMEETIATGGADLIAMARGTIADAFVPDKALQDRADEIIPCIRCFHCLDYRNARTFGCSVNPSVGRELELAQIQNKNISKQKRCVIVGGGPAGLQAAATAGKEGYEVILLEKEGFLGGKITLSEKMGFKGDLRKLRDHLIYMATASGAKICKNTEGTVETIAELSPDVLLLAVGATDQVPDIPGLSAENVSTISQYFATISQSPTEERILVLGGGLAGCETALCLQTEYHKQVTLVEATGTLAQGEMYLNRDAIVRKLKDHLPVYTKTNLLSYDGKKAQLRDVSGKEFSIEINRVILATGNRPPKDLLSYYGIAKETIVIGDALKPSNVRNAIRTGYDAVLSCIE